MGKLEVVIHCLCLVGCSFTLVVWCRLRRAMAEHTFFVCLVVGVGRRVGTTCFFVLCVQFYFGFWLFLGFCWVVGCGTPPQPLSRIFVESRIVKRKEKTYFT